MPACAEGRCWRGRGRARGQRLRQRQRTRRTRRAAPGSLLYSGAVLFYSDFILILFRFYSGAIKFYSDFIRILFRFYSDYILILFWIYSGSDRGDAHFSHNILLTFTLAENGVKQPSSLFPGPAPPIRLVFISAENWVKMTGRVIGFRAAARRCGESTVMAGGICTDPPANRFASLNAPQRAPKRHLGPPTSKRTRKNAYRYRDHEM